MASAAGLKVGQSITVANALPDSANGGVNYDVSPRLISAINGLTVTTSMSWALTVAGGTVYTTGVMLTVGAEGRVLDLVINDNSANQAWARWETTWGIKLAGAQSMATHCYLYNLASEGFELGANYTTAEACVVYNAQGNGFHLSGCVHPVIHACIAINCNLSTTTGHAMGGVGWSSAISDATVSDSFIQGCLNGMGAIDSVDNSDITIVNNTIRSCTTQGISINSSSPGSSPGRIMIAGNRIYACPTGIGVTQPAGAGAATFPNRVTIANNSFDLCTTYSIQLQFSSYVNLNGNRFEGATGASLPIHLYVVDSQDIAIAGNLFNGGSYGVYVDAPNNLTQNVTICGNTFSSQYSGAIRFEAEGMTNVQTQGNAITNDTTAGNNYTGIQTQWPSMAQGNTLFLNNNGGSITGLIGIMLNTAITTGGGTAHALGNIVRGTAEYGIRSPGGSGGAAVFNNLTTATAPLSNGGGTVTTPAVFGTPVLSGGVIQSVPVSNGGVGYSGVVDVFAVGGGGSGASLAPVITSGVIQSVTVSSGGTGYTSPPTVVASGNFVANNQTVP